jgi:uncharacterized protein
MSVDLIRYDLLVQDALLGVVRKVLSDAARDGLPGEHHFYIAFRTHAQGVRLSNRMRDRYPDEMTIVLQHQFWDLSVSHEDFEVGLSFQGIPEKLLVPFEAVTRFADPAAGFELRFAVAEEAAGAVPPHPEAAPASAAEPLPPAVPLPREEAAKEQHAAIAAAEGAPKEKEAPASKPKEREAESGPKVVSIDAFRKKS